MHATGEIHLGYNRVSVGKSLGQEGRRHSRSDIWAESPKINGRLADQQKD